MIRQIVLKISTMLFTFLVGTCSSVFLASIQTVSESSTWTPITKYSVAEVDSGAFSLGKVSDINERRLASKHVRCTDKPIKSIWPFLMKDKNFREALAFWDEEKPDCAQAFDVFRADLNGDGDKEILLRGKITPLCGAVGNCEFWVFEKKGRRFKILLHSSDYVDRSDMGKQIRKSKTQGYLDVLLTGHFSASETSFSYYKYVAGKYVESRCLYEVPIYRSNNEQVRWHFISCRKFYRNLNLN